MNCKSTLILIYLFIVNLELLSAQNLVINPSLEIYQGRDIEGWSAIAGTPDVASNKNKIPPGSGTFNPIYDKKNRLSEIVFGDICLCQGFNSEHSEVLQVELSKPLKRNVRYELSLYTIKISPIPQSVNEVSIALTRKRLPKESMPHNYDIPFISLESGVRARISSTKEWVRVSSTYQAKGREKYLSIGNFADANKSSVESLIGPGNSIYYCYDNVSVRRINTVTNDSISEQPIIHVQSDSVPENIEFNDSYFAFNHYSLGKTAIPPLHELAEYLKDHRSLSILIAGHTDNIGDREFNQKLSMNRALSIKQYLLSEGITEGRIECKAYGELNPKFSNSSEEGRAKNRRIEIKIVRK